MEISNEIRAEVLAQALPYIGKYRGKVVVVKYGGNAMVNDELKQQVMEDIALLHMCGVKIVLVHGGGPEINAALRRIGKQAEFINGLRVTDEETIDVVQMVLAGKVNKQLVSLLQSKGMHAVGMCGVDDCMIEAAQRDPALGYVGRIIRVNVDVIRVAMDNGNITFIRYLKSDVPSIFAAR